MVAPVARKSSTINSKARDHPLFKENRPPYITILSIVRDAAAKLPNGTGTRADIAQILRESQFIVENTEDSKLSNIVSGALDRLHYEDDPCVRYDPENKMWIYLHKGRNLEYDGWKEGSEWSKAKKKPKRRKKKRVTEAISDSQISDK